MSINPTKDRVLNPGGEKKITVTSGWKKPSRSFDCRLPRCLESVPRPPEPDSSSGGPPHLLWESLKPCDLTYVSKQLCFPAKLLPSIPGWPGVQGLRSGAEYSAGWSCERVKVLPQLDETGRVTWAADPAPQPFVSCNMRVGVGWMICRVLVIPLGLLRGSGRGTSLPPVSLGQSCLNHSAVFPDISWLA